MFMGPGNQAVSGVLLVAVPVVFNVSARLWLSLCGGEVVLAIVTMDGEPLLL